MSGSSQGRAVANYRARLSTRGMARYEVVGRDEDRQLIRSIARKLTEGGEEAARLRAAVQSTVEGEPPRKGGVFAALQRAPKGFADLDLTRERSQGRPTEF